MTLADDMKRLEEASKDLTYELAKPLRGVARRLGLKLKPWVREREIRDEWRELRDSAGNDVAGDVDQPPDAA